MVRLRDLTDSWLPWGCVPREGIQQHLRPRRVVAWKFASQMYATCMHAHHSQVVVVSMGGVAHTAHPFTNMLM